MPASERVAVIGVGTMGSQAAWRLATRGAEVVGYDRFAPGHDRSAAGGETRIFRSAPHITREFVRRAFWHAEGAREWA